MKIFTFLFFTLLALAGNAQADRTIELTSDCTGTLNFAFDVTVNGRNQYIDDDGNPETNASLRIAYNQMARRWEIRSINDATEVFYATETNAFAPNPPASTVATYTGMSGCTGQATVAGDGTQTEAGTDPCGGMDDDMDGVCNADDTCAGFDDAADRDGDGTADGCDDNFDGIELTSDCIGGSLDFVLTGTDATGRNVYTNAVQNFEFAFNAGSNRWEVRSVTAPDDVFYFSTFASLPDPPNSTVGNYQPGICTQPVTVSGGGTQEVECGRDATSCDDGDPCTEDSVDDDCNCVNTPGDTTPPMAGCQDVVLTLDDTGSAVLTTAGVDNGSIDDCGDVTLSLDRTAFGCDDAMNGPVSVTLTATDASGNMGSCLATITVNDTLSPRVDCLPTFDVDLVAGGTLSLPPGDLAAMAVQAYSDNCGSVPDSVFTDLPANQLTCDDLPGRDVVLTVVDASGNTASCTVAVEILDPLAACNTAPVAVCQSLSVDAGEACNSVFTADMFDGGSTDADGDSLTFSIDSVGPYAVGTTPIVLTVSDGIATDTCQTTVTIADDCSTSVVNPASLTLQLAQNVPNPFRHRTRIEFTLLRPGPVRLSVYGLDGRHLLSRSFRATAGNNATVISSAELGEASGVLLYTLTAGGVTSAGRMVLIR